MNLKRFLITFLLCGTLLLFSRYNIFAQAGASDSSFYAHALVNAKDLYHHSFSDQSAIYSGSQYPEYLFNFNNGRHPFFNSDQPVRGSIFYDGIKYDDILMRYDETRDLIVIHAYTERIQLHSEKVEYFNLFNADFIRIEKDSVTPNIPAAGFYNILYKGKLSLFKKQVKAIREEILSNEIQHFVDQKDHYYIRKEGRLFPVSSKKDLLKLFKDKKKEVQQFIKANNLNFRTNRQELLTKTASYYDNIK